MKLKALFLIPATVAFIALAGFTECPKSSPTVYDGDQGPGEEFNLYGGGSRTVNPGGSAQYTVTVSAGQLEGGTRSNSAINLSTVNLPSGASGTFSVNPVSALANQSSTLTVVTQPNMTPGTYNFKIRANNGSSTEEVNCVLIVSGAQGQVSISSEDDSMWDRIYGDGGGDLDAEYFVTVTAPANYVGDVTLTFTFEAEGAQGVTHSFTTNPVSFGQAQGRAQGDQVRSTTLRLQRVGGQSGTGSYQFTVTASGPGYESSSATDALNIYIPSA